MKNVNGKRKTESILLGDLKKAITVNPRLITMYGMNINLKLNRFPFKK